jgi:hypothetical protein
MRKAASFPAGACAAAAAAACALYVAIYARLLRHFWIGSDDAYAGVVAARWLWRHAPMPHEWFFKHGTGEFWLCVPFLAAFGQREAALYVRNGAFGALGVGACAALAYEFGAGELGAAAAALFLALTPSWAEYSVIGVFSSIASCALAPLALALWLRAARTRRPLLSLASALALGVALWARSTMLAWTIGMAAASAAGALPSPWEGLPNRRRRAYAAGCAALFLLPQLQYVLGLLRYPAMRKVWTEHFSSGGRPAVDLTGASLIRLKELALLFGAPGSGAILPVAAALALAALAARRKPSRPEDLPWILASCYTALSLFSPTSMGVYHMLPLLPLLWAAVCALPAKARSPRLALALLAGLLLWRGATFIREMRAPDLGREGQLSSASLGMYEFFVERGARPIFLGDYLSKSFDFRSKDAMESMVVDSTDSDSHAQWDAAFGARERLFVISRDETPPGVAAEFRSEAAKRGLSVRLVRAFPDVDGTAAYEALSAEKPAERE